MQINTSKYILITLLLLISANLSAQIGTKKYRTRSGDTTVVVMAGSTGLHGEDAAFLLDRTIVDEYDRKQSRYQTLKEAAQETNQVSTIVEVEKEKTNPTSGSLGFRAAQRNIEYLRKDQEAQKQARANINKGSSLEEMTYFYEKFGNQPSYFINGIQVDKKTAFSLADKDILTRSHKVTNTTTGNPNGEVWYVINSVAFDRLNIDAHPYTESYADAPRSQVKNEDRRPTTTPKGSDDFWDKADAEHTVSPTQTARPTQQSASPALTAQQRELEDLQRQLRELQEQRQGGTRPVATTGPVYREEAPQPATTTPQATRRPTNNKPVEIISFEDSPQERSRRERDRSGDSTPTKPREEVIRVTNLVSPEDAFSDPNITEETPVRSVRRIKDRERNK